MKEVYKGIVCCRSPDDHTWHLHQLAAALGRDQFQSPSIAAHQRIPMVRCAPRSANPEKNQRRNVSGLMTCSKCCPAIIPARAGTRARSEYRPVPKLSVPALTNDQASAMAETVKERPSACMNSARSKPSA